MFMHPYYAGRFGNFWLGGKSDPGNTWSWTEDPTAAIFDTVTGWDSMSKTGNNPLYNCLYSEPSNEWMGCRGLLDEAANGRRTNDEE